MSSPSFFPFPSLDWTNPENMHAWLQKFLDAFLFGILVINESNEIYIANAAAHAFFGVPSSSPLGDITRFLSSEDAEKFRANCERVLSEERFSDRYEEVFLLKDGAQCWMHCSFAVFSGQEGGRKLALVTLMDVSTEKALLEQHEFSVQQYRELFDAADAMMIISSQGNLLELNKTTCEHMHMTREELMGKHIRTIFTPAQHQYVADNLEEILQNGEQRTFEALLASPASPIPVEISARSTAFQGQPAVLSLARDITERKILQARLEYQASTDSLTKLNNRRHFLIKAGQEFLRFKRYGNTFGMLVLDLDFFKNVNDTFGHQTGDALLREFARQLRLVFRHSDVLGRIGGEEFSVVLLETSPHRSMEAAERLRQQVAENPLQIDGIAVPYTVSIGVTTASASDASLDVIIRRADTALYRAKRNGRNQVAYEKASNDPEQTAQELQKEQQGQA